MDPLVSVLEYKDWFPVISRVKQAASIRRRVKAYIHAFVNATAVKPLSS